MNMQFCIPFWEYVIPSLCKLSPQSHTHTFPHLRQKIICSCHFHSKKQLLLIYRQDIQGHDNRDDSVERMDPSSESTPGRNLHMTENNMLSGTSVKEVLDLPTDYAQFPP